MVLPPKPHVYKSYPVFVWSVSVEEEEEEEDNGGGSTRYAAKLVPNATCRILVLGVVASLLSWMISFS